MQSPLILARLKTRSQEVQKGKKKKNCYEDRQCYLLNGKHSPLGDELRSLRNLNGFNAACLLPLYPTSTFMEKGIAVGGRMSWLDPGLQFPSATYCVTLDKPLDPFEPLFPHLCSGDNKIYCIGYCVYHMRKCCHGLKC